MVLLNQGPPNLNFFKLMMKETDPPGGHQQPHLCPIIRVFCERIKTVDLELPYLCSQLLLPKDRVDMTAQSLDHIIRKRVASKLIYDLSDCKLVMEFAFQDLRRAIDKEATVFEPYNFPEVAARAYVSTKGLCSQPDSVVAWIYHALAHYGENITWVFGGK